MSTPQFAIDVQGLSKQFLVREKPPGVWGALRGAVAGKTRAVEAVREISFRVERGEAVALIGPNGAGKSTTIKMLTGILHPSGGQARVLGLVPWRERTRLAFRIGVMFGQRSQLWYHLPPLDSFDLLARIYELPRADYLSRRKLLVERFELGPLLGTPVRKLSLGQRMRCEVAAALLHRPELIFLDEPTIGLDVVVKQRIRELIRAANREEGVTVLVTSHDVGDMEELCRRVLIVNHGRLIYDDRVSALRRDGLAYKQVALGLARPHTGPPLAVPGVEVLKESERGVKLRVAQDERHPSIDEVLARLLQVYAVRDITITDPPLESVIAEIYTRSGQAAPSAAGTGP